MHEYLEERKEREIQEKKKKIEEEKKDENIDNDNKEIKKGKTYFFPKTRKNNKENANKSTKKVNFLINPIKEINSTSSSIKKIKRKVDLNDNNDERGVAQPKYEDNNYEAESYDLLNGRSPVTPVEHKKGGILINKTPIKKSLFSYSNSNINNINTSINSNIISKKMTFNQDKVLDKIYSMKNGEDDFAAKAEKKISDLKLVLGFIKYFEAIEFNKILFQKDQFFKNIFGKDIKEEFL